MVFEVKFRKVKAARPVRAPSGPENGLKLKVRWYAELIQTGEPVLLGQALLSIRVAEMLKAKALICGDGEELAAMDAESYLVGTAGTSPSAARPGGLGG